ncbi:serine hydrolase domain-containing protein [Microbacterium sp. X-17]|uniref:serine hydrolase domain-containing protein n=1 Tax=Microbacterium sp. X-17 TaxID=3144404 RepID=UPI0031F527B0
MTRIRSAHRRGIRLASATVLASVVALVAAGCSAAAAPAPSPTELSGISTAKVEALFQQGAADLHMPGAFLLLETPDGEFSSSYGATQIGGETPPAAGTHIRVGSNTKTWTGTVILQLAEEGKLKLDDPVSRFRSDVPNGENITIRMLLDMRSGLYNYTEDPGLAAAMDANPQRVWAPAELIKVGLSQPPYFAPDQGYHYSNTNTAILGTIIEQLENKSLHDVFQERLFNPLGMSDTLFPVATDADLPRPLSHGYSFGTNVGTLNAPALDASQLQDFYAGLLAPDDHTFDNPSWAYAAGAGISTAHDLAIWAKALANGTLLDPAYQAQRTQFQKVSPTAPSNAATYGLALANFGGYYGHTGELPGYNSFVASNPKTGVTLVVWANLAPTGDGKDPATTIARSIIESVG